MTGKNCTIVQNPFIGERVSAGDNVKIGNNVSIFEGVIFDEMSSAGHPAYSPT